MCLLRESGYAQPIYLHGALRALTDLYVSLGVDVGSTASIEGMAADQLKGALVLVRRQHWPTAGRGACPIRCGRWPRAGCRSGHGRGSRVPELPLTISDHADWDELLQTVEDIQPGEVWVDPWPRGRLGSRPAEAGGVKAQRAAHCRPRGRRGRGLMQRFGELLDPWSFSRHGTRSCG